MPLYDNWKEKICKICGCCDGGHGGDAEGDKEAYRLVSNFITDSVLEGEHNFDSLKSYADKLAKENIDRPAHFVYASLAKVATLSGDVTPLKFSTAMIDYARFLDQKGNISEADTMYNISLLNLNNYTRVR